MKMRKWKDMLIILLVILCEICACDCGTQYLTSDLDADTNIAGDIPFTDGFWNPPIENLGDPGWRDSTEPWCAETADYLDAYNVWSKPNGVYVLARYLHLQQMPVGRDAIFFNNGTGWTLFWEEIIDYYYGNSQITGFPEGPLIVRKGSHQNCTLQFIEDGEDTCQSTEEVLDVFVVNENLAYALKTVSGQNQKVIYYDGSTWGPVPAAYTPYEVERLWADEENIFCTGRDGTILSLDGSDWHVHDTGTLNGFGSIWGFGGDDVWAVGGETWLMHFDGELWNSVEWPYLAEGEVHRGIYGMWGTDGILFFFTQRQLTMWDGYEFRVLLVAEDADGSQILEIRDIWGNSPTEVFLAVSDYYHPRPGCGIYYLLWWDGEYFHWF